jgi:hypothetical protein
MASFKISQVVDPTQVQSCLLGSDIVANGGGLVDADIGKPVKLVATDRYDLCAVGDEIADFIQTIEPASVGGYSFGTIRKGPFIAVELSGAAAVGTLVEAAAITAAGTALANGLPIVSVHVEDITTVTTLRDTTFKTNYRVVSGTGLAGDLTAVVERV